MLGEVEIRGSLKFKPYDTQRKVIEWEEKKIKEALRSLSHYGLDKLPVSKKHEYRGDPNKVVTIVQGEYAVISEKYGKKKVANTFRLADCIGLILEDNKNGVASVAHIDSITDVKKSIYEIIKDLNNVGGEEYQARLFGGSIPSCRKILEIVRELEKYQIKIVEADILEKCKSRAIGVSIRGILYNNVFKDNDPTLSQRMEFRGYGLIEVPLKCHCRP